MTWLERDSGWGVRSHFHLPSFLSFFCLTPWERVTLTTVRILRRGRHENVSEKNGGMKAEAVVGLLWMWSRRCYHFILYFLFCSLWKKTLQTHMLHTHIHHLYCASFIVNNISSFTTNLGEAIFLLIWILIHVHMNYHIHPIFLLSIFHNSTCISSLDLPLLAFVVCPFS